MRAWVDGKLLEDAAGAAVAVADHGVTVGDGVFEVIKVVEGRPFALTRHLARLERSAAGLGLPRPHAERVKEAVADVLAAEPLPFGRVRITWTGGAAPLASGRGDGPATLMVAAEAMERPAATTSVITVPWPRNERGALAGLKTTSYAENVVALARAHEHDATEAIFANTAGSLCEGTATNVFYVVAGELRTPTLGAGCLAGITRALVLEWYGGREVDEPIEVLTRASEIFLTSTTRDVQGVGRCDGRELSAPGEITAEAARAWREREEVDEDP